MNIDEGLMDIRRITRAAMFVAHNEAIRQAKFEISLTLMNMRVHTGVESGLLKAMDGLILNMEPRDDTGEQMNIEDFNEENDKP